MAGPRSFAGPGDSLCYQLGGSNHVLLGLGVLGNPAMLPGPRFRVPALGGRAMRMTTSKLQQWHPTPVRPKGWPRFHPRRLKLSTSTLCWDGVRESLVRNLDSNLLAFWDGNGVLKEESGFLPLHSGKETACTTVSVETAQRA